MIDLLIPVLGRPGHAQPLVDSIQAATTSEHLIIFICSPGDNEEIAACEQTGQVVWTVPWLPGRADFALKINWAFERTFSKWILQGADDIRFSAGWDVHALNVARKHGASVIGTNDLHNPNVKRRVHSTHTLFSRFYIEEQGGTRDGSGLVFSTAYDHQWCDTEFIDTARERGVWAFSERSVVEHLHPHWGRSEMDATYEKALRETRQDRDLYLRRKRTSDRQFRRLARRR